MSKDMNMKIIKMTTQLCLRFGAHPRYCAARAEMVLVQQCLRNRKTENSNIKYQTHKDTLHNVWSELTVTGVSAKQSVEIVHGVLGEI